MWTVVEKACKKNRLKIEFIRQAYDKYKVEISIGGITSSVVIQDGVIHLAGWMQGNKVILSGYTNCGAREEINYLKEKIKYYIEEVGI